MFKTERRFFIRTDFSDFSEKQLKVLTWWADDSSISNKKGIICDGAIRSGKTVCMALSFTHWAMSFFNNHNFALCGKDIKTLRRNVLINLIDDLKSLGFVVIENYENNSVIISKNNRQNTFYLFNGGEDDSASRIQGLTLAGVMFDETALLNKTFVNQAIARCSISGSKWWFNCNPEHPYHWFYCEWIKKADEKNLLYFHFSLDDNPALSEEIKQQYKLTFTGNFYDRFILGKWVSPEGKIYDCFSEEKNVVDKSVCDTMTFDKYYVSCDYGTVNPFSAGLWGHTTIGWVRIKEFYYSSKIKGNQTKTDEEYYLDLENLIGQREVESIIVDPSASSFIQTIKSHEKYDVQKAKNDVLAGINAVSEALKTNKIFISSVCQDTLREFSLYVWSTPDGEKEKPKKQNDHAMDDIRYFVYGVVKNNNSNDWFFSAVDRKK